MGVVLGGSDNGIITIWNMDKLIKSEEPLVATLQEHVGAVRSLDVNPFQPNLIASGASESEVYIWDLNNTTTPMSPGSKPHPLEDISGLAWNRQVQHILASTSPGGRSIVWDLRKNEPIIQVSDSNSRVRCKDIAWHPDVATQMVTCSEDDRSPVIQLWDLRYATAPFRTLERHQRGVLSLAWCSQDSDLLLSAAKDNHVYCWNPNIDVTGGEVVYELPATSQWIFECAWCPRNPAIISTSSFDGHISLYSILGGGTSCRSSSKPQSITDSNDPFSNISSLKQVEKESIPLKSPPKWFRRPCGARFGFGGQLVSFSSKNYNKVNVNVVVTEPQLVQQSEIFEDVINQQKFGQFCEGKLSTSEEQDKMIWSFLKVTFEADPRRHYLNLLGYNPVQLAQQVTKWVESCKAPPSDYVHIEEIQEEIATLPLDNENEEEQLDEDKNTSTASLFGDSSVDNTFDDFKVEPIPPAKEGLDFSIDADNADGMLTQALLVGNFKAAVDICINADRMSEALILSVAGGSDLFQSTQKLFFEKNESSTTKLISLITSRNWSEIVQYGNLDNWREILAVLVTYATNEDFAKLCDILGERLEEEGRDGCYSNAALCYICSGNINKFVDCCLRSHESIDTDPMSLQEFVEMVTLLHQAVMLKRKSATIDNSLLSDKLSKYVSLLASQGSLQIALLYLQHTNTQQVF
jgi:protein transport protein SEC31